MSKHNNAKATTTKAGIHGRRISSASDFVAVVSGKPNQYGLRSGLVVKGNKNDIIIPNFEKHIVKDTTRIAKAIVQTSDGKPSNTVIVAEVIKNGRKFSGGHIAKYKVLESRKHGSSGMYGKLYNQEVHDVNRAISSLAKFIKE